MTLPCSASRSLTLTHSLFFYSPFSFLFFSFFKKNYHKLILILWVMCVMLIHRVECVIDVLVIMGFLHILPWSSGFSVYSKAHLKIEELISFVVVHVKWNVNILKFEMLKLELCLSSKSQGFLSDSRESCKNKKVVPFIGWDCWAVWVWE